MRSLALASLLVSLAALGCSGSSSSPLAELHPDAGAAADAAGSADAGGSVVGEDAGAVTPDAGELGDAGPGPADAAKDAPAAEDGGAEPDAGELDAAPPVDAGPAVEWYCDVSNMVGTEYSFPMCPPYGSTSNYTAEQMACGDHSAAVGDASIPDAGAPICPTSAAMPCPTPHCSVYVNFNGPAFWAAGGLVHQ